MAIVITELKDGHIIEHSLELNIIYFLSLRCFK
jgi:hypothetical protein